VELAEVLDEVGADWARLERSAAVGRFHPDLRLRRRQEPGHGQPVCSTCKTAVVPGSDRSSGCAEDTAASSVPAQVDRGLLIHERELDILRALSELPETVTAAAADRAHRIACRRHGVRATRRIGPRLLPTHRHAGMGDGVSAELDTGPTATRRGGVHRSGHRPRPPRRQRTPIRRDLRERPAVLPPSRHRCGWAFRPVSCSSAAC